ncbi:MAG: ribonuclease HII [Nanoarchaeota archaeon]
MLLIGIDDAGRGPLIGPMILAGVLIEAKDEDELKEIGARDSKLLAHSERIRIEKLIKDKVLDSKIVIASPDEIDSFVFGRENLNTLEAKKMAEVINSLNKGKEKTKVLVDCPSINIESWRKKLLSFIDNLENLEVVCEHKADFNHPVVSAASILAKVRREEEVDKLKKEYGEIGSGYPSDPTTQEFLRERGKELENSGIFRKSWSTWQTLFGKVDRKAKGVQKKLF